MRAVRWLVALAPIFLPLAAQAQDADGPHGLASGVYDGTWRVEVETTVGNCQKAAVANITVKGAKVVGIDASGLEPWGYIDADNVFVGRFSQGERVLRANGDVKGGFAYGPWSSSTDFCGGRWSARKLN